jgi:hypothetical protein
MSVANEVAQGQGILMVGEFISGQPGKVRESQNGGASRTPYLVRLLVGSALLTVEYWDAEAAGTLIAAERGDVLTIPVYARAYKDRVYWRGVSPRGE